MVANAYLEGTYTEVYPHVVARRGGPARALPPVLVPGRHPEPRGARDAGLDPRGRRARLLARARVRGGVRQPGPRRRLRRRRRRGGDRPARHELALEQVPQPAHRRRRAADPAPERLQDRQPDRARPHPRGASSSRCSRATATSRSSSPAGSTASRPQPCTSASPRRSTRPSTGSRAIQRAARERARRRAPALADDRPAHAEGLDGPERGRRPAGRGHVALAPGAARRGARRTPTTSRSSRSGCESYRPEELFDETGALRAGARRARARRASGG